MTTRREANFFDVLRVVAAAAVVVGHSWPLLGLSGVPTYAGISIHHLGVYVFFTISGYLLARSWSRAPEPLPFLTRRAFRIFPALVVTVVLTTCAIGPLMTAMSASGYWNDPQTWSYLQGAVLMPTYELPGVFLDNPSSAVNGSLWSLGPEFCCYLTLVALGLLTHRISVVMRAAIAVSLAVAIFAIPITGTLRTTLIAVVFFAVGSLIAELPAKVRFPPWVIPVFVIVPLFFDGRIGVIATWLLLPIAIVTLGEQRSRFATWFHRGGDPSYGMYLWAFPVQQIITAQFGVLPLWSNITLVLALSAALGYSSWHLVEKHAIAKGATLAKRVPQWRVAELEPRAGSGRGRRL